MTTHLRSRNASWQLKKTKWSNIKFSNPVGCIYENSSGIRLVYKGKKQVIKKKSFIKFQEKNSASFLNHRYSASIADVSDDT